jgi:hypothetical protein
MVHQTAQLIDLLHSTPLLVLDRIAHASDRIRANEEIAERLEDTISFLEALVVLLDHDSLQVEA